MLVQRINTLSCDRQTFDQSAPTYSDALSKSNFNVQLKYEQQNNTRKRHNRTGNVPSKANAYKQMLFTKPT